MTIGDSEVAIIGGGAAGIAAGRRLRQAAISCLVIEARGRLGGRAWTVNEGGFGLDLGCGWLHSADRNPWVKVAEAQKRTIDRTPPPWSRPALPIAFPLPDQEEFAKAQHAFYDRLEAVAHGEADRAASAVLEPNGRWNNLITAIGTYITGAELEHVSVRDFDNYADTGVNWRVVEGYGTTIAAHGAELSVVLDSPVLQIDHRGKRLKIETAKGVISADQAIVTLPTSIIAEKEFLFAPALPAKTEAARNLPLGLNDKLFLSLEDAEEFDKGTRIVGRTDRVGTAIYHMRPFGRPMIEAYFGGTQAADLEANGDDAFFDFAAAELGALLGSTFVRRIKLLRIHRWGADPFARGSYSYAMPGMADCRASLAEPVDGRLFFAGEACSRNDFSTAHGGWFTGVAAAEQVIAARRRQRTA